MNRSQSDGVLYQLTGTKHGLNLLVSIYSLREHQYDGPIAILAGCRESQDIAARLAMEKRLHPILIVPWTAPDERTHGAAIHSANKTVIHRLSPFVRTVFLDADTLVDPPGEFDVLELLPDDDAIHLTRLGQLTARERPAHCNFQKWHQIEPQLVGSALQRNDPAINTGVLSFTNDTAAFFNKWHRLAHRNISFFCNEVSAQLIFHEFNHKVFDDRWNRSPVYSKTIDPFIWHGHGNTFITAPSGWFNWDPICREVLEKNIADVKSWLNQIPPERKPRWAKQT